MSIDVTVIENDTDITLEITEQSTEVSVTMTEGVSLGTFNDAIADIEDELIDLESQIDDAQNDATQALSDASSAQQDATQALSDASSAQDDATQALSDAADAMEAAKYTAIGSRDTPVAITESGGITHGGNYREIHFIEGDGGPVDITADPQISAGTEVGQELVLIGRSDDNPVTLNHGDGLELFGQMELGEASKIGLIWDGTLWSEKWRSN